MVEKGISNKEIIATVILFALTLFIFQSLFSQLLGNNINNNAYAQSYTQTDLIVILSGSHAPHGVSLMCMTGYTIEPVVWNLTAPDSITFDDNGNICNRRGRISIYLLT